MEKGDAQEVAKLAYLPKVLKKLPEEIREKLRLVRVQSWLDERFKTMMEAKHGIILSYKCGEGYQHGGSYEPKVLTPKGRKKQVIGCGSKTGWTHIKSYEELLQFSKCSGCGFDNKEQVQRELSQRADDAQTNLRIETERNAHFLAITSAMK